MFKTALLTLLIFANISIISAQIIAVTESGDQVILNQDGTWQYVDEPLVDEETALPVNETNFIKSKNLTFLVKSNKLKIGIWIDSKSWSFEKGTDNEQNEYQFQKKGEDLYAMLISEKMQIPLETMRLVAVQNAKGVAPDIKIVKEELRNVNGIQVLMMQMAGTIKGIKFVYFGYYYSNENGTVQLLTYTSEALFAEYEKDMEIFLNGLVKL
jgi:hypothetical protein